MARARATDGVLVMLLAGGQGERLYPLTKMRAKPAVPFAGLYRIIDFTLSNCLNSDLRRIYVLTQHMSLSLDRHVRAAWGMLRPELGEFVQTVPPQLQLVSRWYAGTADAVFHNLHLLEEERPEHVLILSGDHIYRMNYAPLLEFHAERRADLTVVCTEVPIAEATRMGVLQVNADAQVTGFAEKPATPSPIPGRPHRALINMGVYVFDTAALVRAVIADAKTESRHDFGHNIIPALLQTLRVYAYNFAERTPPSWHYWQDVGTLDSYYDAHMDLLQPQPSFDLFETEWPLRRHADQQPPTLIRSSGALAARAENSLVSPGCAIVGASVHRSILSPRVRIEAGAVVEASILMPGVRVGAGARIRRAIVDERVVVPPDTVLGHDADADARHYTVTPNGVTVIAEGTVVG
jgi:glucose-1-phosphate adenylyltransferase